MGKRCTIDKQIAQLKGVEVRQVLSTPPWFDVYYFGQHKFGTLNIDKAFTKMMELTNQ